MYTSNPARLRNGDHKTTILIQTGCEYNIWKPLWSCHPRKNSCSLILFLRRRILFSFLFTFDLSVIYDRICKHVSVLRYIQKLVTLKGIDRKWLPNEGAVSTFLIAMRSSCNGKIIHLLFSVQRWILWFRLAFVSMRSCKGLSCGLNRNFFTLIRVDIRTRTSIVTDVKIWEHLYRFIISKTNIILYLKPHQHQALEHRQSHHKTDLVVASEHSVRGSLELVAHCAHKTLAYENHIWISNWKKPRVTCKTPVENMTSATSLKLTKHSPLDRRWRQRWKCKSTARDAWGSMRPRRPRRQWLTEARCCRSAAFWPGVKICPQNPARGLIRLLYGVHFDATGLSVVAWLSLCQQIGWVNHKKLVHATRFGSPITHVPTLTHYSRLSSTNVTAQRFEILSRDSTPTITVTQAYHGYTGRRPKGIHTRVTDLLH